MVLSSNVRRDLAIHQPFEQPDHAVSRVACQPLGPQIEATSPAEMHIATTASNTRLGLSSDLAISIWKYSL
jgi:hypothetical protein